MTRQYTIRLTPTWTKFFILHELQPCYPGVVVVLPNWDSFLPLHGVFFQIVVKHGSSNHLDLERVCFLSPIRPRKEYCYLKRC